MRILFSLTYYTPYISGLTLYVKRLGEALGKKGYQVSVLTMNFDKHCRSAEIVNGVKVVRAGYLTKISKGFLSFDWIIKSWQEVRKTEVVIVNLPQFEGIIPALFGKLLGKKVIAIYHCEVILPPGIFNKFINWLLDASNLLSLWLSKEIITYTPDFAGRSKLLVHFRSKLKFVYPPILPPKIDKRVQNNIREEIGAKSGLIIGVVARLAAEKGMEYLLEGIPEIESRIKNQELGLSVIPTDPECSRRGVEGSLANASSNKLRDSSTALGMTIPKFKIIIAGSMEPVGEENYKRKILELVEKYKDDVVFLGELKEEEMGSFYSLLDVLVLPSVNSTEAFGMVQVEAMIAGIPVIATDLPGVRIPIQKTGMGKIVPIKNSQKLSEAIVEILLNKKKYIKDKELVKKEFAFEKTVEFYQKLLNQSI